MEIVYYYDKEKKQCPFNKFLQEKINECSTLSEKRKKEIGIDLIRKISYIKERNGKPDGGIAKRVKGYGFHQIRQAKDKHTVIRILYFCYDNLVVLLYAFEKPRAYNDKKTKAEIKKHYKETSKYCEKFKKNPKSYIKL